MIRHSIDQEVLIKLFSQATAQQGEAVRKAVNEATLKALQGRELSLPNIKQVLNTVARSAWCNKALSDIEKMEGALFDSVRKAATGANGASVPGAALQGPRAQVLGMVQGRTTSTGALASSTVAQLLDSVHKGLRDGCAIGLKAPQAMLDRYSTLVSGALIGMSDALAQGGGASAPASRAKMRRVAKRAVPHRTHRTHRMPPRQRKGTPWTP